MNGACGPAMRTSLHNSLSRDDMTSIDVGELSAHKEMMHPTRSEANVDSFAKKTGKVCGTRSLLKCERKFFNRKAEDAFAERSTEFSIKLKNKETAVLVLEKTIC